MQTPEDVLDGALSYFTVILAGIPLTMAYNLESALLQSMGNSVTPLGLSFVQQHSSMWVWTSFSLEIP